jgi:hypothetical protein
MPLLTKAKSLKANESALLKENRFLESPMVRQKCGNQDLTYQTA